MGVLGQVSQLIRQRAEGFRSLGRRPLYYYLIGKMKTYAYIVYWDFYIAGKVIKSLPPIWKQISYNLYMNNGNCMDLSQSVYVSSQIYVPFFRLRPGLYLNSGLHLSLTDLLCCRAAVGLRPQQWRTREVAEMILRILGSGKSVL